MAISPQFLVRLQSRPDLIRNICILAHVDHGKTTLSDNLLASNGIISQSLQGKIRYLDSRPDEQARGITMESSAISLYFKVASRSAEKEEPTVNEYLINLIDSPGHIDFSSEVSTASRLCDGAVIVVDVVEGVSPQTVTVLRQAWEEKMKPILVINKFDRLITELQMTPLEAYTHVSKLIEQVNAVVGSFFAGQRMEEDMKWRERLERLQASGESAQQGHEFVESSDDDIYFAPEMNNVVFGSAVDGWGFNIAQFAAIYARRLGMNRQKLESVLWGDYYYDPKNKTVIPGSKRKPGSKLSKPLFVQFVLDNIWAVYDSTVLNRDPEKSTKIINSLDLKVPQHLLKSKDTRALLLAIMGSWIPMSRSILLSVTDCLPSPVTAQKERTSGMLEATPGYKSIDSGVSDAMIACDPKGPVTAYISKVVSVPEKDIPTEADLENVAKTDSIDDLRERSRRARELAQALNTGAGSGDSNVLTESMDNLDIDSESSPADDAVAEKLIGFARVFSGTVEVGQQYNLLSPRYNPVSNDDEDKTGVTITGLYLLMGRDLIPIKKAPAGSIVGIAGLDGYILKTGTLVSNNIQGPNLASTNFTAPPILRVAIEPADPTKIPQLEEGLKLLNMSDPCVQIFTQDNGELILATAGELHLERCIKDLKERFAKVDVHYSKPIVPYRETITTGGEWKSETGDPRGYVKMQVETLELVWQVSPLPTDISDFLSANGNVIRGLVERQSDRHQEKRQDVDDMVLEEVERDDDKIEAFGGQLDDLFAKAKHQYKVEDIVSLGPKRTGANIFFDSTGLISRRLCSGDRNINHCVYEDNIVHGFQQAMAKGPLVAEPLEGVACVLVSLDERKDEQEEQSAGVSSARGRVISATREAIHQGVSDWSPRLKLATYMCEIQAPAEVLGRVYGVITRRRGRVLSEDMKEGTPFFTVRASLPVAESFGFSEEIRKRTSGAANPQLVFAGFEVLDQDPFWVPTTEEELEELGELADRENIAMNYVQGIRKRKGLSTLQKLVDSSDKQRTMKR